MNVNDIYVRSCVDGGLLYVEAPGKLENLQLKDAAGKAAAAQLFGEKVLDNGTVRYIFDASGLEKWSPDTPVLYTLECSAGTIRFGYSELRPAAENCELRLNGSPCYMRGYIRGIVAHEHPNMTGKSLKDAAVKNIRQAKKYGFNLVRFHSTIPTAEFVEAADEEGIFIHMEIGFAYEMDDKAEKKNLSMDNKAWVDTILKYRNHPSVAIFCIGNEMHKSGHYPEVRALYEQGRELAPGKMIMDNSGWGEFDRQTADVYSQHIAYFFPYKHHGDMFYREDPWLMNGSAYDEPLDKEFSGSGVSAAVHRTVNPAKPYIAHEAVHYIEIPDYSALNAKFDAFCAEVGEDYLKANDIRKPRFMTALPELIERKGLTDKLPDYIKASEKFKMMGLKTYLEECRLADLCGFEMLQFADCLKYENKNGIVDCFDDDKYIPAEWMRQFNGNIALLCAFREEVYYYGENVDCDIFISNYLPQQSIVGGKLVLTLKKADGSAVTIYEGENVTLSGKLQKVAEVDFMADEEESAQQVEFCAEFTAGDIKINNSWKLWFYPDKKVTFDGEVRLSDSDLADEIEASGSSDRVVTDVFDEKVFEDLADGRDVILFYHRDTPGNTFYLPGALERFKPCIWDRGSNLGGIIYSDLLRKTLAGGRYFDKNMQPLLEGGYKVCLDEFPCKVNELICGVDKPVRDRMKGIISKVKDFIDSDTLRNFSHLFSIRVGNATLTVCTFSLKESFNPAVNNFLAELLGNPALCATDKSITPDEFKAYLAAEKARGEREEDVMNHFWEIDNKLVEDTLFWEQTGLDLSKIR